MELVIAGQAAVDTSPLERVVAVVNQQAFPWLRAGQINLKFVDDAGIRAFNEEYSGQDKPTDVLSFSYVEAGQVPQEGQLGDMVISLETAERQAEAAGNTTAEEVALLGLHGILHILGFDHGDASGKQTMEQLQREILQGAKVTYRDFQWA